MAAADDLVRLQRFFNRSLETMSLAGVHLYINPQTYEEDTQVAQVDVVTYGGIGRFDFGVRPTTYRLEGTTGTAGVDELVRMRVFDPGNPSRPARSVGFTYPNHFTGIRHVWVDRFTRRVSASEGGLYFFYTIELKQYPTARREPALALTDVNSLGLTLPPGG